MSNGIKCPHQQPTLQFGAKLPIVKEMQTALNQRLAQVDTISKFPLYIPVTGYFGEETKNAVKYLQCLVFLRVDGIVEQQTWAYLRDGAASLPLLHLGSSGRQVLIVQDLLKSHDYYTGIVDGIFGVGTEAAVCQLQAQYNLNVDGVITESTWMILSKLNTHTYKCSSRIFGGSEKFKLM
jgi:peptidoglycan hydrolase-like protein with peptidoglycan-binding domain